MSTSTIFKKPILWVAALGYFVDIYDLLLFSIIRIPSLTDLGIQDIAETGLLILNTQMFPYMAIILPIYVLYSKLDFINTYQGLVIAELGLVLPFSIWMMKGRNI